MVKALNRGIILWASKWALNRAKIFRREFILKGKKFSNARYFGALRAIGNMRLRLALENGPYITRIYAWASIQLRVSQRLSNTIG